VFGWSTSAAGVLGSSDTDADVRGSGTLTGTIGIATASTGVARGVYGESNSPYGTGVAGYAGSSTGTNYGVLGMASSPLGYGVRGIGKSESGAITGGAGVWGDSKDGVGVYGSSNTDDGVYGRSTAGSGVHGYSQIGTGVSGNGLFSVETGVCGTAPCTGTVGIAYASGGIGVYGQGPSDGYGVYSEGNTHVEGELTWKAKTSYVSVPAAAFHPRGGGYDFTNNGHTLQNGDSASDFYLAPVQLPHGATVTKMTFYWWDYSTPNNGLCSLYRINLAGSEDQMANALTSGDAGASTSSEDTIINYAKVDNSQYAYYLWLHLPDSAVKAHGVVIEYTTTEPN
jgi:hypothetical protein